MTSTGSRHDALADRMMKAIEDGDLDGSARVLRTRPALVDEPHSRRGRTRRCDRGVAGLRGHDGLSPLRGDPVGSIWPTAISRSTSSTWSAPTAPKLPRPRASSSRWTTTPSPRFASTSTHGHSPTPSAESAESPASVMQNRRGRRNDRRRFSWPGIRRFVGDRPWRPGRPSGAPLPEGRSRPAHGLPRSRRPRSPTRGALGPTIDSHRAPDTPGRAAPPGPRGVARWRGCSPAGEKKSST